jgi:uncharacterized protein YbjT (DUF2867 family)
MVLLVASGGGELGALAQSAARRPAEGAGGDADDIADVAAAALTESGHAGQVYELTGPRLLSFPEAIAEIVKASGREIAYVPVSVEDYATAAAEQGAPAGLVDFLAYLFRDVLGQQSPRHRRRAARCRSAGSGLHRLRHAHRGHRHLDSGRTWLRSEPR